VEFMLLHRAALRSADPVNTDAVRFGVHGYKSGLAIIESTLDQAVSCQLQGKAAGGAKWQNVGAAVNVGADGASSIAVSAPWSELRVQCTPADVPTNGVLNIWLSRAV
jgi:hypothetical protein